MNKMMVFQWSTLALIVLNISLISFVMLNRPGHGAHRGPDGKRQIIIEKLGFDESQIRDYRVLIESHQATLSSADEQIRTVKKALYSLLSEDDKARRTELISQINEQQVLIENAHFDHFVAIKNLCNATQLPKFEALTNELGPMFAPKDPKKNRP